MMMVALFVQVENSLLLPSFLNRVASQLVVNNVELYIMPHLNELGRRIRSKWWWS